MLMKKRGRRALRPVVGGSQHAPQRMLHTKHVTNRQLVRSLLAQNVALTAQSAGLSKGAEEELEEQVRELEMQQKKKQLQMEREFCTRVQEKERQVQAALEKRLAQKDVENKVALASLLHEKDEESAQKLKQMAQTLEAQAGAQVQAVETRLKAATAEAAEWRRKTVEQISHLEKQVQAAEAERDAAGMEKDLLFGELEKKEEEVAELAAEKEELLVQFEREKAEAAAQLESVLQEKAELEAWIATRKRQDVEEEEKAAAEAAAAAAAEAAAEAAEKEEVEAHVTTNNEADDSYFASSQHASDNSHMDHQELEQLQNEVAVYQETCAEQARDLDILNDKLEEAQAREEVLKEQVKTLKMDAAMAGEVLIQRHDEVTMDQADNLAEKEELIERMQQLLEEVCTCEASNQFCEWTGY